jgi:hypothetical protein
MMRAPDTRAFDAADEFDASRLYGTFSPAQWQIIKADLDAVGIDLDTAMLPSMPDKPWWLPGDSSLRDAIQTIAHYYGLWLRLNSKPPTPWQRAEDLQAAQGALVKALDLLDPTDLADDHTWSGVRARIERRHAVHDEITDLKERIAALKAKGNASAANSKTLHNDYWRDQARVWMALKPNVSRRDRRGHLRRLLFHCSASLFADVMTEPEIESRIAAFVDHFLSSKRRLK